ncbi:hypothetical protein METBISCDRAFT_17080 [Metschnikowia bicuspidata]|uniref:MHD domain-containing protein n=1 Tax=Metschnikowia bicuspidata TaxID=27322 RepID=A0A4P9ZBC6_9ASCO|nr:hypothetical protein METBISCDRAFT_17080 [Metschnikowia bicuspidata]
MADFPTAILTSKSPEDVAKFLPRSLKLSQILIEQNLVAWFSNYMNMIMRYNHDLNTLVANGRHFLAAAEGEFGAIDKIWNCVALCVMSQIHVNDSLLRTIRNDILRPFNAAFKNDFKYSELLINSEELLQMLGRMNDAEGAYNWNTKAPAILLNFENYKRYEKQLLFNAFIAYLSVINSKNASLLSKNENAVNFILKEFNINKEMDHYAEYMVNTKVEVSPTPAPRSAVEKPQKNGPVSSVESTTSSSHSPKKERRKSKLMLRVGLMLGRKKKGSTSAHSDTIPEDHSATLVTPSRLETYSSRAETRSSLYQAPPPHQNNQRRKSGTPSVSIPAASSHVIAESSEAKPRTQVEVPDQVFGVPNVEKYGSSDDESDVPVDKNGNRLSLLNTHNLGNTPKVNSDPKKQTHRAFTGKYSFEYGDEEKLICTPTQTPKLAEHEFQFESHPPVYDESIAQPVLPEKTELKIETRPPPPPPPPSRKAHNTTEAKREVPSYINESFSHGTDAMFMRSQMTGNTLLKLDYFKHFDAADDISRPGLNTSIAEIINVSILRGEVTKSQILGEIAFNYNAKEVLPPVSVKIPLKFSRFLLNDQLVQEREKGIYNLHVAPMLGKTLGGIKYSLNVDPTEVPILIKQIWKLEETQASLIVKVMLNPLYGQKIHLDNFVVSASLDNSVSSTSASSKPEGSFNKDANRITWRYTKPLVLSTENSEENFIARIMTNGVGKEASSGVRVKFSVILPKKSFAKIMDLDNNFVPSVNNLSSGNYSSHFQ